ncbi:unnamed protein product [Amoebophrya sp. A120]|nr:unnamed protein product [Amoebophrya sp. A120]|eukprot:GSA120T00012811001.1
MILRVFLSSLRFVRFFFALGNYKSYAAAAATPVTKNVIWIGDSVTRYTYLDYVYRKHSNSATPPSLLWEGFHGNWTSYYKASTAAFNGSMRCECFREGREVPTMEAIEAEAKKTKVWPPPWVKTVVENRFWSDRYKNEGTSSLTNTTTESHTFFSYIGDFGGCRGITNDIPSGWRFPRVTSVNTPAWQFAYENLDLEFALRFLIPKLKPTHLILNLGWWPHTRDFPKLERIFSAARDAIVETPAGGTRTGDGVRGSDQQGEETKTKPRRVLWKGGTPSRDNERPFYAETEDRVRHLARTRGAELSLQYVGFPKPREQITKECFCDRVHFCCPELYEAHNLELQRYLDE